MARAAASDCVVFFFVNVTILSANLFSSFAFAHVVLILSCCSKQDGAWAGGVG
jgi:hypothetical protein